MNPPMPPKWHYCSLAAGSIAFDEGWLDDEPRVKRLAYALYEAAMRTEPTQCPTRYADGATPDYRVKGKRNK